MNGNDKTGTARVRRVIGGTVLGTTLAFVLGLAVWNTTADAADAGSAERASHRVREATATLRAADGSTVGNVTFRRRSTGTKVVADLRLTPGTSAMDAFHGFHVHANDKPENGTGCVADPAQAPATWFVSADGHLTEPGATHGHHTGDLPTLLVDDDGRAHIEFSTNRLAMEDLKDRAVVIHAGPDNYGNVPTGTAPDRYTPNSATATEKTAATGNAGDRLACGLVQIVR